MSVSVSAVGPRVVGPPERETMSRDGAEMMVLEEHHHQPACDDPHGRFARPGTVEMLCCKAMAALDRPSRQYRGAARPASALLVSLRMGGAR